MNLPIDYFPICSTSDVHEAQTILSRELTTLRIQKVRDHRTFRMQMNGVHLGRTLLGYNHFESDTSVNPGETDGMLSLVIGAQGSTPSVFHIDGEPIACIDEGAVISPSKRVFIDRPTGSGVCMIKASYDAIAKRFAELTDHHPRKSIVFHRSVDLTNGIGSQARRIMYALVDTIQQDPAVVENPLLRAGFDDMLLNILLALPNNYSVELMNGHRRCATPALVAKAEEFMETHATDPITISDLVAVCGCSRPTIFNTFRRYRGYTPMQFLTDCRLKSARDALRSPSPSDTVTSIAYACGFSHLGRFTAAYRKRFNESPSDSLRKAALRCGLAVRRETADY
jgi:AraC-like DNA-binding protein